MCTPLARSHSTSGVLWAVFCMFVRVLYACTKNLIFVTCFSLRVPMHICARTRALARHCWISLSLCVDTSTFQLGVAHSTLSCLVVSCGVLSSLYLTIDNTRNYSYNTCDHSWVTRSQSCATTNNTCE